MLSALLIAALGLPVSPVHALRPIQEGKGRTGLEEVLRPDSSGLEEAEAITQETVLAYQQQRPWSDPVLAYWRERGISSEWLAVILQEARHGVIQGKVQGVDFELWNDMGEAMDAYHSDQLPGVTVKLIKVVDPEKIARLKHGYKLAKQRLGGRFVLTLVENFELVVNGEKHIYPYALIQQKARLVREILAGLADQKWELIRAGKIEQAEQVERERLQKEQDLEKEFVQLSEEMFALGVWDDDFTNWRNNYGFVEGSPRMMGFDGDRITEIEHFASHRFPGSDSASDQRVIGPVFSREHIQQVFDQARGTAVFRPVPDLWGEEIQNAQRSALNQAAASPAAGLEEDQRPFLYTGTYERVLDAAGRITVPPEMFPLRVAQHIVGWKRQENGIHFIRFEPLSAASSVPADDASRLFSADGQGRIRLSDDWMDWIGTVPESALTWLGVRDHAELWNAESWSRFQQGTAGRFGEIESAVGLEEQRAAWRAASELADGFRSRSAVDSRSVVVIGRDLAQRVPGLQVLSGLEERVVIDRGDLVDTLARAAQLGDTVYFYGDPQRGTGLEELASRFGLPLSFVLRNPGEDSKIALVLRQIFEDLGVPSADISSGLEEFTRSVEELGLAA